MDHKSNNQKKREKNQKCLEKKETLFFERTVRELIGFTWLLRFRNKQLAPPCFTTKSRNFFKNFQGASKMLCALA
jgi:hypothetical protein